MKAKIVLSALLLVASALSQAYELATEINQIDDKVILKAHSHAKLGLIKLNPDKKGKINLNGVVSVQGKASVVMWAKVDGNYYFSRLPALQNMDSVDNLAFSIPFDAADKLITEIILEVELTGGSQVEIGEIKLQ